jgi:3-oxoacyl-[acyl-carrier-protein] synthase-3
MPRVSLIGLAGRLGSASISVEELGARLDLAPDRIREKTGVTALRRFAEGESPVEIARQLSLELLACAGIERGDVRGVFGSANPTADDLLPTFTAVAAHAIGLTRVIVDHVGVGCCGGLQALRNAHNQLVVDALSGRRSHCLVVVADRTSRILDPARRQTGTLFGEGVSVALVGNDPAAAQGYEIATVATRSLLGEALFALRLRNPYAGTPDGALPRLEMDGRRVFEFGANIVGELASLLGRDRLPSDCFLIPHQSNLRMLEAMIERAGLDPGRVYVDGIRTVGNTSAPSALLGLEDALRRGLVGASDPVVLGAFGAELQVGAALLLPIAPERLVA